MRKAPVSMMLVLALGASLAQAGPLTPRITSHDFNFGASEPIDAPFYDPRGDGADFLTLNASEADREVTAFWEVWPGGVPLAVENALGDFGGDLEMYLEFDAQDATPSLDVSLTGQGRNAGADIIVWGAIPDAGISFGMLLAIDVTDASLYGFGGNSSFVLETIGTLTFINPNLPGAASLAIGDPAATRGNIDFLSLALPSGYDPLQSGNLVADGGGYSGELGVIPEPASLLMLLAGTALWLRRRR